MPSDLDQLVEFGFDRERAQLALKKTGGLQPAIDWLAANESKSLDDLKAEAASAANDDETNPNIEPAPLAAGEVAQSLKCDECGKKFRSVNQAQAHGERTGHEQFSESTEAIAPLTEEEKKEKLEELRRKAAERKAQKAILEKEEQKANEKIRQKSTKEIQDIKEDLANKERIKEAQKKRQEKLDDIAAKKRIQEKIAVDKEARRLKAEQLKAEREGRAPPPDPSITAAAKAQAQAPSAPKPANAHTEARLRLQTANGNVMKTFPAETTLFEVAEALKAEGNNVSSFTMNFPRKVFEGAVDFGKTLKEAGLVPSAALIVK